MNQIITQHYPMFQLYQSLRGKLMDLLSDEDLRYTPGGSNPTLGELCREMGETQHAYIQSFKTFTQDFSYRNTTPGMAEHVDQLKQWYAELDQELRATIEALSEDDVVSRLVERGPDFKIPPQIQLDIYKEALLLFYGKATVYMRAMDKPMPEQWHEWIG